MKKIITFVSASLLITSLNAASIGMEESYSNSSSYSHQKNIEKSDSKTKEKTKSSEKGFEKSKNKSFSKNKSVERSFSKERSLSYSKNLTTKSTISINVTQLMPEIDYLVNRILRRLIVHDKYFINNLPISRNEIPDGMTKIPIMAQYDIIDNGPILIGKTQRLLIRYLSNEIKKKIFKYIFSYFKETYFRIGITAGLKNIITNCGTALLTQPNLARMGMCDFTIGASYWAILSGDIQGQMEFSFEGAILKPINLMSPKYYFYLFFDPIKNTFVFSFKNKNIIYLSNSKIAHFYGDLVLIEDYDTNNILVVDQKINADGLYLNQPNSNMKFDSYFKKLMKLYLEAFQHLYNGTYSFEEAKFLIRKYIYEKVTGRNDFIQRYINDSTDF